MKKKFDLIQLIIVLIVISLLFTTYLNLSTQKRVVKENLLKKSNVIDIANSAVVYEEAQFIIEKNNSTTNYVDLCNKIEEVKDINGETYLLTREFSLSSDGLNRCKIKINVPYTINSNEKTIVEKNYFLTRDVY